MKTNVNKSLAVVVMVGMLAITQVFSFLVPVTAESSPRVINGVAIENIAVIDMIIGNWYDESDNLVLSVTKEQINGWNIARYGGFELATPDGSSASGHGRIELVKDSSRYILEIDWTRSNETLVLGIPKNPDVRTRNDTVKLYRH